MSQLTQEVETANAALTGKLSMLGSYIVSFNFTQSATSTRTATAAIQNPPVGLQASTIAVQSFNVYYTDDEQYGFGRLGVSVSVSGNTASCTVTLRDNHLNERVWEGTVTALVTFYGI
jgi:hypothetical protein